MATYTYTLTSARKTLLTDIERAVCGFSHKFTVPFSDLTGTAATTATDALTITLGATPGFWLVDKALVNVTTAWAGTGGLALTVGTTGTTNAFVTSTSVLTIAAIPMAAALPILTNSTATTSSTMVATLTNSVSGSIAAATAGQMDIFINLLNTASGGTGSIS